jgi:hypothetical protein
MSAANKALSRAPFEAADRGRTPVELCVPGFTAQFPGPPPMDLEGLDQFEAMIRSAFSNIGRPIEDMVGEGDEVAVRLRMKGTPTPATWVSRPAASGSRWRAGLMEQIGAARARPGRVSLASRSARSRSRRSQRPTEFPSRASERFSNGQVEPYR